MGGPNGKEKPKRAYKMDEQQRHQIIAKNLRLPIPPFLIPSPIPAAPPLAMATTTMSLRSLAMAMADAALPPAHKLLPAAPLPLLSSSTRAAPLLLRATRRLPLAPLVASSDAVEAGVEWADDEEEVVGEAFDEEVGEAEDEVLASGDEEDGGDGEGEYAAVEPPEEAKVYVGNLPYDVDSEGLAQLFDQAGVVEVAEVRAGCRSPNFPHFKTVTC